MLGFCQVLHLNDNFLSSLPLEFDGLKRLRDLRLHNNPLRTPPMDVCVSGVLQPIGRFIRRAVEREGTVQHVLHENALHKVLLNSKMTSSPNSSFFVITRA